MRFRSLLVHVVAACGLGGTAVSAQMPPGVVREPARAIMSYSDLDRFAEAFARLPTVRDTAAFLDSAYLAGGSEGLRVYAGMYGVDGASLRDAIRGNPHRYASAAAAADDVRALETRVRAAYANLAAVFPEALFPTVFYLVGPYRAGGAVQREGILIAVETHAPADASDCGVYDRLVHLVAHELAHYQLAAWNLELYQRSKSLLARAIREGSADLVAELISGDHTNPAAHAYGIAHEADLWRRFRAVMDQEATGDWFFARPADPAWPRDLGYFVGYRIALARYEREPIERSGMLALLRIPDYREFLETSRYGENW